LEEWIAQAQTEHDDIDFALVGDGETARRRRFVPQGPSLHKMAKMMHRAATGVHATCHFSLRPSLAASQGMMLALILQVSVMPSTTMATNTPNHYATLLAAMASTPPKQNSIYRACAYFGEEHQSNLFFFVTFIAVTVNWAECILAIGRSLYAIYRAYDVGAGVDCRGLIWYVVRYYCMGFVNDLLMYGLLILPRMKRLR
jgi:hypothetical protein